MAARIDYEKMNVVRTEEVMGETDLGNGQYKLVVGFNKLGEAVSQERFRKWRMGKQWVWIPYEQCKDWKVE